MFRYRNYLFIVGIISLIFFSSCGGEEIKDHDISVSGELIPLDSLIKKDKLVDSIINIYRIQVEQEMNQVLVHSEHVMERGTPEGLLNNFVADLVFDIGQELYKAEDGKPIDFCLLNYGGLRTSLPEGPVTKSRVFELLPFENEMIVITLSGEKTKELFEYLAESKEGMPVSNLKLGISENKPKEILIDGEQIDTSRNYKVLTSDYLAYGGDDMTFFLDPLNIELIGKRIRDAIILHMERVNEKGKKISSQLDQRIYYMN
ncbi:MAG: 5'-nucleotidase C-terminal domain-containing protein [Bacteroidota bacterium]